MIDSAEISSRKVLAVFAVFAVFFTSLGILLFSQPNEGTPSQDSNLNGLQDRPGPLDDQGEDPSPANTTLFPWPMHLHDELHRGYTNAPAPTTSNVLWSNATGYITYGSPAVVDGKVFIGARTFTGDYMFAFYQSNGTQIWRTKTIVDVNQPEGGLSSSPAYWNGYLLYGGDRIYCLWANNGTIKWTVNTGNLNWGDGTPTVAGGKVFIGAGNRRLYNIDIETGNILWTFQTQPTGGSNYGLYAAPAIYNGHAYLAACDGWVYQILIDQPGPTATANHSFFTGYAMYGSPVIFDGKVYVGNGYTFNNVNNRFYALDVVDLSLVWQFYPGAATSFLGSAAVAYDKLFVGSVDGNLYVLDPYGSGGSTTIIWQYSIGSTWASPAISSGKVFIGSRGNYLYAFDVNQSGPPTYLWRYNTMGNVDSSAAIADGALFIGSHGNGGMIYSFGQVGDVISPFPLSHSPTGTGVPVNTDFTVQWSEDMDWASVEASFSYTDLSTVWTSADGTFNHNPVTRTSTFNPFVDLSFSTTYYVTFSSIAQDLAGNPLDGDGNGAGGDDLVWSFQTVIDNPPSLNVWEPGGTSGQSYTVGTMVPIVWEATDDASWPNGGNVINLTYGVSPFGGTPISQYELDDGNFNWDTTGVPLGTYYVNVTAFDSLGQVSGSYSNFTFDIVAIPDSPPVVSLSAPVGGLSWSGGALINIDWTMSDDITLVQNLEVYLNFTSSSGSGSIAGPLTGLASPATYPWTLPPLDATDVVVLMEVIDESGNVGSDMSPQFEVDSTPPILDSHSPWIDETNVATNANVFIEWREGMNVTATEGSFSLRDNATWTLVPGVFSWDPMNNLSTMFDPNADLSPNNWYTANFTTAAKDDSQPGNNLAFYSWSFLTAAVPDVTPPLITNVQASPSPQEVFFPVWTNASITDLYGIAEAHVEVFDPSMTLIGNFTMLYVSGNEFFFARNYDVLGVHTCAISSVDNNGNWAQTSSGCSFEMVDNTAPWISNILKVPSPVEIFNPINISASVTDNYAVASANVNIVLVGNFSMTLDSVSGRYYHEHVCMMLGPHDFTIWAVDTSGNWASAQGQFDTVDTEPPLIVHTPPSQVDVGSTIDFQATVTDNHLVDSVWLNYTDASGIHFNVSMSDLPGNDFQLTLPVQNQAGQVVYHIYAVDQSGNGAVTGVLEVSVVDITDDLAPMPPWGLVVEKGSDGASSVINWEAPVLNEDMSNLDDLAGYHIYRSESETGQKTRINPVLVEITTFVDDNVEDGKEYFYWVTAIDESANESDFSTPADISFSTESNDISYDIILLLLAIIIIVVLLIAALLWRKKKGEETSDEQPAGVIEEPASEEETELE
jgi:outer membrane protein assembly factor BamB